MPRTAAEKSLLHLGHLVNAVQKTATFPMRDMRRFHAPHWADAELGTRGGWFRVFSYSSPPSGGLLLRNVVVGLIGLVLPVITSCTLYQDMQAMKTPRYEPGAHGGAAFCGGCHQEIYQQWRNNSRHSVATNTASFHHLKDEFTSSILMNTFVGESTCYACHGSKAVNDGVDCETCHGVMPVGVSVEEVHERKFRPGLAELKEQEFCAKCHDLKNPISGELLLASYDEWKRGPAAAGGVTCQGCHMAPRGGKLAYHGFDTAVRNDALYQDVLSISEVVLDFPWLRLTLENRVRGHPIPVGGPTRTLALEVSGQDEEGKELHNTVRTFAKRFSLMPIIGIMPYRLIENTQLQPGEKRALQFSLPRELASKIRKVVLVLRMYEVSDEHQGNIEKAHWASKPIIRKEVPI